MIRIAVAVSLLFVSAGSSAAQPSSDLESYLEGIRASGVSEMARMQIQMMAGICAGATILEYHVDDASGRYYPSYTSAVCPKPNADPPEIERWKIQRRSETDLLKDKLKPFADADGSGFVSTEEGNEFRALVEFGYLVEQVNRHEGASATAIARASGETPEDVARRFKAYDALARRIHEAGVAELPVVSLKAE